MNIRGSQRALNVARQMKNLEAYIHVSTTFAYSNRLGMEVKEQVYEPVMDYHKLLELAE